MGRSVGFPTSLVDSAGPSAEPHLRDSGSIGLTSSRCMDHPKSVVVSSWTGGPSGLAQRRAVYSSPTASTKGPIAKASRLLFWCSAAHCNQRLPGAPNELDHDDLAGQSVPFHHPRPGTRAGSGHRTRTLSSGAGGGRWGGPRRRWWVEGGDHNRWAPTPRCRQTGVLRIS